MPFVKKKNLIRDFRYVGRRNGCSDTHSTAQFHFFAPLAGRAQLHSCHISIRKDLAPPPPKGPVSPRGGGPRPGHVSITTRTRPSFVLAADNYSQQPLRRRRSTEHRIPHVNASFFVTEAKPVYRKVEKN